MITKIVLNDDVEIVAIAKEQLKAKNGYCPCCLLINEDTKCMCKDFREQEEGLCPCGLYRKIIIAEEIDAKKMEE